ncbi:MAG: DUF4988 domain-containing protein [Prevotellaceae bacterium]|jgi:hypothetical protein|nr:DUF4988 domain-containing protein [Prevotellaceae bacterium]
MKKILSITMMAALLAMSGCKEYNDSKVWDNLYNLQLAQEEQARRLAALKARQTTVNGNIDALKGIAAALQSNDYVTGVTAFTDPAPGGYRINFTKSPQVTIRNSEKGETGEDGEKGETGATAPQIGVREDGGVYCWTLGGEWLEDADGNKIPVTGPQGPSGPQGPPGATGITPTLRINPDSGDWEVCLAGGCDEGCNEGWKSLDVKATGNDGSTPAIGADAFEDAYYWTVDGEWLTDADGNKIPLTG